MKKSYVVQITRIVKIKSYAYILEENEEKALEKFKKGIFDASDQKEVATIYSNSVSIIWNV